MDQATEEELRSQPTKMNRVISAQKKEQALITIIELGRHVCMSTILIIGTFKSSVATLIRLLEYEQSIYVTNVRFCWAASC